MGLGQQQGLERATAQNGTTASQWAVSTTMWSDPPAPPT